MRMHHTRCVNPVRVRHCSMGEGIVFDRLFFSLGIRQAMSAALACILGINVADAARLAYEGAVVAIEPDSARLAEAITALLGDEEARARVGECARTVAARDFSANAMADRLIALYRGIATERAR